MLGLWLWLWLRPKRASVGPCRLGEERPTASLDIHGPGALPSRDSVHGVQSWEMFLVL